MAIKDSGERKQYEGMVRDVTDDKIRYDLALDGPMFKRWAEHLTAGAKKYSARNWMGAKSQEELDRFRESALRHFIQWFTGETDEDHAAAVLFNINGAEYVKSQTVFLKYTGIALKFDNDTSQRTGPADRRKCRDLAAAITYLRRSNPYGRRLRDRMYEALPLCNTKGE